MKERVINWLFDTILGRVVGVCLVPFGIVLWLVISVALGEDLFLWAETRRIRKAYVA